MRQSNLFLTELWVGKCQISQPVDKNITLSFRIGKNVVNSLVTKTIQEGCLQFNTTLQLNTDKSAIETQRCSLALSVQGGPLQSAIIGIVLISISNNNMIGPKKSKMIQCADKNAQIEFSLRITPLEQTNSSSLKSSSLAFMDTHSSQKSILEMRDFDKKIISPPKLHNVKSQPQEKFNFLLAPPKPRASRQKNQLTMSISSQVVQEMVVAELEKEKNCLKELLKIEMKENEESMEMINRLTEALSNNTSLLDKDSAPELDETLLLEDVKSSEQLEVAMLRIEQLNQKIEGLIFQNQSLAKQNKQLQELVLKLSEWTEDHFVIKNPEKVSAGDSKNGSKDLMKKLQLAQKSVVESNKKFEKLRMQIVNLEGDLISKMEEFDRYKKKSKIQFKFASLKQIEIEKSNNPTLTIKLLFQRQISQKKEMVKLLQRLVKQDNENSSDSIVQKVKQKIERSFNVLIGKRLNKEILTQEKGELLKGLDECIIKVPME